MTFGVLTKFVIFFSKKSTCGEHFQRNQGFQARNTVSTRYRFHAIESLENFHNNEKAQRFWRNWAMIKEFWLFW